MASAAKGSAKLVSQAAPYLQLPKDSVTFALAALNFCAKKLSGEEKQVPSASKEVEEDLGFRISDKLSRYLGKIHRCLNYGEMKEPNYGVDWNTLYGFSGSARKDSRNSGALIESLHRRCQELKSQVSGFSEKQPLDTTAHEANRILSDTSEVSSYLQNTRGPLNKRKCRLLMISTHSTNSKSRRGHSRTYQLRKPSSLGETKLLKHLRTTRFCRESMKPLRIKEKDINM